MSDQPPTSHELFHDVTDSRPRAAARRRHPRRLDRRARPDPRRGDRRPAARDGRARTWSTRSASELSRCRHQSRHAGHHPHTFDSEADAAESVARRASRRDRRRAAARAGRVCELCRRSEGGDRGLRTRRRDRSRGAAAPTAAPVPQKPPARDRAEHADEGHDVAPIYPTIARQAGVEGMVIIEAVIAVDGTVRDARVLRSVTLLDHAALDAVKQALRADAPQRRRGPVIVTVTAHFALQR